MKPKIDVLKVNEENVTKILSKFNRSEKSLEDDVAVLQKWIKSQYHLPNLLDTHSLKNFLLLNKGSIEMAKQKIDNYYTIRSKMPQIFGDPQLLHSIGLNDALYLAVYPGLTDEMYKLLYCKIRDESLQDKYEVVHVIRKFLNLQELRLREDMMCGDIFIVDLQGLHSSTVLRISPIFVYKNLLQIYGKIFSFRFKGLYLMNVPSLFTTILDSLKSFVKPKLLERVYVNPSLELMKQKIPLTMIPKEFGGEGFSLDVLQDALEDKFRERQDLFNTLNQIKVDDELRPRKLEDNDVLGFHGNFKTLEID